MSQEYNAFPLSWPLTWPRTKTRSRSRFGTYYHKPTVAKARDHLMQELGRMGCPSWSVVISTNIPVRRDGLPYSNRAEPDDPGVAVYFRVDGKPTVLACDRWTTVGDNIWAIAKHVEALRGQERWGVGSLKQAFAGYAALEEKTERSCWEVLGIPPPVAPGLSLTNRTNHVLDAYRRRARETHPDAGGSSEAFAEVVRAKDMALQLIKGA